MVYDVEKFDLTIVGGGIVGLTLAKALAPTGLKIAIIEKFDPNNIIDESFDGRVLALAQDTKKVFETLDIWNKIANKTTPSTVHRPPPTDNMPAGDIDEIRIVDDASPMFLHFDGADVTDDSLGHVVEIRYIRRALYDSLTQYNNIELLAPAEINEIEYNTHNVAITLADGNKIITDLLVGADGRGSKIRKDLGIHTTTTDYKQSAMTFVIKHEKPHNNVAIENFLPSGPFAILPMGSGYHSSIVWSEKTDLVPLFMQMKEEEFITHLRKRTGDFLGKIQLTGKIWDYPLSLIFADKYIDNRVCLVGDAAHGIHPISGQGFNLGMRDVAFLAELIASQYRLGLDIGSNTMLEKYQSARKINNSQMIAATDGLTRLFSNDIKPIKLARRLGLKAVENQPALKKYFMKHAMGNPENGGKLVKGVKL